MYAHKQLFWLFLCTITPFSVAQAINGDCCKYMGGVHYCDSSASRFVCKNGYISSCYCSRHAVMDLQRQQGCCLWKGGVFAIDEKGLVICNNGGVSETCSMNVQTILAID